MPVSSRKQSVLFICTHNSARSQMAEGLLRFDHGDKYEAHSAGTRATFVKPMASDVMAELGIDLSGHQSKTIDDLARARFDYIVTVCDRARESCPYLPATIRNIHCSFDDPSEVLEPRSARLEAFRRVRDEIRSWLNEEFGSA